MMSAAGVPPVLAVLTLTFSSNLQACRRALLPPPFFLTPVQSRGMRGGGHPRRIHDAAPTPH